MAVYDVHTRNQITDQGVKNFIIGLVFIMILSLVAFFALLTNQIVFYATDDPGDVYNIIFGFLSISITVGVIALIAIYFFGRGLAEFHKTKTDYPGTKRERHVNLATLSFVLLIVFFLGATVAGTGLLPEFKYSNLFFGGAIFIPGAILYGLFFTSIVIVLDKSKMLLLSAFGLVVAAGILYMFFPLLLAILGFVSNLFFLLTYIHIKSIIRHEMANRANAERGRKDLAARMYRQGSKRHGEDADFDTVANPYTARRRRDGPSETELKKMFREKSDGPKQIKKRIPKEMRYENCPMCGEKLPPYDTVNKCPACKEDLFD